MTATARPDLAAARATTERHASTFAFACRLLPGDVRDDVYLLYLVFRSLDDLVDEGAVDGAERVAAAAAWAAGQPHAPTAETVILDDLAGRHRLPEQAVTDFCAGMGQDLAREELATERAVDRYCYRVAGTVGVIMAEMLGTRNRDEGQAAAAALGMAMQRTNILRDIDEDLAAGRIYVASETVRRHGGSLAPGRRAELMRDQIARADALYEDGMLGIAGLRRGRAAITLAAELYREILREIERRGLGVSPGRAVVPGQRKLATVLRTVVAGR